MMTNEERIQTLHARMAGLQQARERRKTGAIGVSCIGLAFCLLLMVFDGGMHAGGAVSLYSGATMLFEGAGPYVLIAIVAFMAGVIVTTAPIRNRKKENGTIGEKRENVGAAEGGLHKDEEILEGRKS